MKFEMKYKEAKQVYDEDGNMYEWYGEKLESGYLVRPVYVTTSSYWCDGHEVPEEDVSYGKYTIAEQVFDKPPVQKKEKEITELENKIEELKNKIKDHQVDNSNLSKLEALCEVVYAKCLKLERTYYKLNKRYRFQSYLNRLNDYFYVLRIYINKEM